MAVTISYETAFATLALSGLSTGSSSGLPASGDVTTTNAFEVRGRFTGTELKWSAGFAGAEDLIEVSLDGGAFVNWPTPSSGGGSFGDHILWTGLNEDAHDFVVRKLVGTSNVVLDINAHATNGGFTIEGGDPALAMTPSIGQALWWRGTDPGSIGCGWKNSDSLYDGTPCQRLEGVLDASLWIQATDAGTVRMQVHSQSSSGQLVVQKMIDGAEVGRVTVNANDWTWVEIATGQSGTHTYGLLVEELQNGSNGAVHAVSAVGMEALTAPPLRIHFIGDSITNARTNGRPAHGANGFVRVIGRTIAAQVSNHGVSTTAVTNSGHSTTWIDAVTAMRAKPDIIVLQPGTNDMGAQVATGTFKTAYRALIDGVLAAAPAAEIHCWGILNRAGSFTITRNDYNQKLQEAVTEAAAANPSRTILYFNTDGWLDTAQTDNPIPGGPDGTHPNDTGHAGIAAAYIAAAGLGGTIDSVTINEAGQSLYGGETFEFSATVEGDATNLNVNWSTDAGSIDSGGVFIAPGGLASGAQSVTITAASQVDGSKTDTVTVTVPAHTAGGGGGDGGALGGLSGSNLCRR